MGRNKNLRNARISKNDDFYTLYQDIDKEMFHYKNELKGKVIYCNCDDPTHSNFWSFFHRNFSNFGLKKLIATYYNQKGNVCRMEYTGGIDDVIQVGRKFLLKGNGDFQSKECIEILDDCDIVISNPPFSCFLSYMCLLMEHQKKFLIVGNKNSAIYKDIFPYIKSGKVRFGYHNIKEFSTPDGTIQKFGNIGWFTNLLVQKDIRSLHLECAYQEGDYPKYENFDAIDVNRIRRIPMDYDGVMGVPTTFLDYYDPEQYELIGYGKENEKNQIGIKEIPIEFLNNFFAQGGKGHYTTAMRVLCFYDQKGKAKFPFVRLLIKRKND